MRTEVLTRLIAAAATVLVFAWTAGASVAVPNSPDLLTIGTVGPKAIGFKAWTNRPPEKGFKPGDRVFINFEAREKAYVLIFNVSSSGDVSVLFPNKENPNNLVEPGRVYTLFGNDSKLRLRLGDRVKQSRIGFYVSSKPVPLDMMKPKGNQPWVRISVDNTEKIEEFRSVLERMAAAPGFNRTELSVKSGAREEHDIRLMSPKRLMKGSPAPIQKRLPGGVESDTADSITGTQGLKPDMK